MIFRGCVRTSLTLDIVVAGALIVGSRNIPHHKLVIEDENVKFSPTADGLVVFGVWNPSKQPSQVLDLASWTLFVCVHFILRCGIGPMIMDCTAMPLTPRPGAMCSLHWSSHPGGLYCPMLALWIHPGRCFLTMPRQSGILHLLKAQCRVNFRNVCFWNTATRSIDGTHQICIPSQTLDCKG